MPDDDDMELRLRELERDHRLTRWYTGRVDRDLAEIATTQAEHTATLKKHTELLQAHTGRFDSLDSQMRSLTQMMGEVLKRLPHAPDENGD